MQTSFKEKEVKNELNTIGGTGRGPIGAGGPALTRRAGGVSAGVNQSRLEGKHRFCVVCRFWWPVLPMPIEVGKKRSQRERVPGGSLEGH